MNEYEISKKEQINYYWRNKNVLITGGSQGLGKELALHLRTLFANVAVVARDLQGLNLVKKEDDSIITIQGDISKKEDTYKISGQVVSQIGSIDVLINNASTLGIEPLQNLIDSPCENFLEAIETNLLGPFRLIKAILPSMILKHSGIIVNITSDASISVYENWGIYGVSKAALDHLTAIWSKELPDITFLAIDPGDMYTKMHLNANPNANKESLHNPYNVAKDLSIFLSKGDYNFKKTRFSAYEWRERLL